jgi:FHA domain
MELLLFALRALMALALLAFVALALRRLLIDRCAALPAAPPPLLLRSEAGRAYTINAEAWIGRDPNCQILLADEFVSTRHARLLWDVQSATWQIEDAGSRNGTLVIGDEIGIGRGKLVVAGEPPAR